MKIAEIMTTQVKTIDARTSAYEAARLMADEDIGALPVLREGLVVGLVTDRDILTRVVAQSRDPKTTPASEFLSGHLKSCRPDEDVSDVARSMSQWQLRRLPVLTPLKALIGIVSIDDIRACRGAQAAPEKPEMPPVDPVDEAGEESFPASDPPSFSPTRAAPGG